MDFFSFWRHSSIFHAPHYHSLFCLILLQTTHVFSQSGIGVGEPRGRQKSTDLKQAPHPLWNSAVNCPYSLFVDYAKQSVYTGMLCILNFVFFVVSMFLTHTVLHHAYATARLHCLNIAKSIRTFDWWASLNCLTSCLCSAVAIKFM